MIAVDTSALMAIVLNEPQADACIAVLAAEDELLISAGTMAEALIVSLRRNVGEEVARPVEGSDSRSRALRLPRRGAALRPISGGARADMPPR